MQFTKAIVRIPGENFSEGLTSMQYGKPDYALTLDQHQSYCQALESCGLNVIVLESDLKFPDSTFVEDTAILTPECSIITYPGAPTRTGETVLIHQVLKKYYENIKMIEPPGTLDGGDICQAGSHFFIGLSDRSNESGTLQLESILKKLGYTANIIDIRSISDLLHLKSGIAYLSDGNLVVVDSLKDHPAFHSFRKVNVNPEENYAANCVNVNDYVLIPANYPKLSSAIKSLGYSLIELNVSEFQKMDGGLSCLSLRF